MTTIILKRGTTTKVNQYAGPAGELIVDTDKNVIKVQDGAQAGGHEVLTSDAQVTKLSQLTDKDNIWTKSNLQLGNLTNDVQMWKKNELTKVSQLNNDSDFKTGYCTYCSYCSNCSRCNDIRCNNVNCNQIQCNNIQCNTVNCTTVQYHNDSNHTND
jgi:hypothetical protein